MYSRVTTHVAPPGARLTGRVTCGVPADVNRRYVGACGRAQWGLESRHES